MAHGTLWTYWICIKLSGIHYFSITIKSPEHYKATQPVLKNLYLFFHVFTFRAVQFATVMIYISKQMKKKLGSWLAKNEIQPKALCYMPPDFFNEPNSPYLLPESHNVIDNNYNVTFSKHKNSSTASSLLIKSFKTTY